MRHPVDETLTVQTKSSSPFADYVGSSLSRREREGGAQCRKGEVDQSDGARCG